MSFQSSVSCETLLPKLADGTLSLSNYNRVTAVRNEYRGIRYYRPADVGYVTAHPLSMTSRPGVQATATPPATDSFGESLVPTLASSTLLPST